MLVGRESTISCYRGQVDYSEPRDELVRECKIDSVLGLPPGEWSAAEEGICEVEIETKDLRNFSTFKQTQSLLGWNQEYADPIAVLEIFAHQNREYLRQRIILTFFVGRDGKQYSLMLTVLGTSELECSVQEVNPKTQFGPKCVVAVVSRRKRTLSGWMRGLISRVKS